MDNVIIIYHKQSTYIIFIHLGPEWKFYNNVIQIYNYIYAYTLAMEAESVQEKKIEFSHEDFKIQVSVDK